MDFSPIDPLPSLLSDIVMATLIKPYLAQATADVVRQENLAEGGTIAVVGLLIVFLVLIFLSVFIATLPKVLDLIGKFLPESDDCLLYTSPSPRDMRRSRMPSSA